MAKKIQYRHLTYEDVKKVAKEVLSSKRKTKAFLKAIQKPA